MLALLMAAIVTTGATAAEKGKTSTVQGTVTAAANDSLTIAAKGGESMTFVVDSTTKVLGKGLTTKTNEKAAVGEKLTLSDTLGKGDMVSVSYHEMEGKMHAGTVKVRQKAMTAK
jgi:hypothetical protein